MDTNTHQWRASRRVNMKIINLMILFLPSVYPGFITRQGSQLYHQGDVFRFSGVNIYWLGQDENNPDVPGGHTPFYSHPSMFRWESYTVKTVLFIYQTILTFSRIKDVLTSAVSMGATVVRSHTLGKYCKARVLPCIRDTMNFMSIGSLF